MTHRPRGSNPLPALLAPLFSCVGLCRILVACPGTRHTTRAPGISAMPNIAQIFWPPPEGTRPVLIQLVSGEEHGALGAWRLQLSPHVPPTALHSLPQASCLRGLESWGIAEEIHLGVLHSSLGFYLLLFSQHQKSSSTLHVSLGRTWHWAPLSQTCRSKEQQHEAGATGRPGGAHQCPLSLEDVKDSACVPFCLHGLCSACIQHWARQSAMCSLCRQLFQLLVCSVPADGHSKEYTVPSHDPCHSTRPRGEPQCPAGSCTGRAHWQSAAASLAFCWLPPSINTQMPSKSCFLFYFQHQRPTYSRQCFPTQWAAPGCVFCKWRASIRSRKVALLPATSRHILGQSTVHRSD